MQAGTKKEPCCGSFSLVCGYLSAGGEALNQITQPFFAISISILHKIWDSPGPLPFINHLKTLAIPIPGMVFLSHYVSASCVLSFRFFLGGHL